MVGREGDMKDDFFRSHPTKKHKATRIPFRTIKDSDTTNKSVTNFYVLTPSARQRKNKIQMTFQFVSTFSYITHHRLASIFLNIPQAPHCLAVISFSPSLLVSTV